MNLTVPANAYFFPYDADTTTDVTPPVARTPEPAPDTTSPGNPSSGGTPTPTPGGKTGVPSVPSGKLGAQDTASGQITEALSIAVSGFVVYVDTNNNGALDLTGTNASSTDQIIGGNKELFLAYLQGGGALDYEKLRDKSGILPQHGFNLAWQQGRWLSLDLVELKLTSSPSLPSPVCYGGSTGTTGNSGGGVATTDNTSGNAPDQPTSVDGGTFQQDASADGGSYGYPDPSDPGLTCAPDGRSYSYVDSTPTSCPPQPPQPPPGLCGSTYAEPAIGCAGKSGSSGSLPAGQDVPPGWPCPTAVDGGTAPDSGVLDAGAGPG
jgi:hypothetical protein